MSISIPILVDSKSKEISKNKNEKASIDEFLNLLVETPLGSVISDPEFGFIFSNFQFEILNENDGVINYEKTKEYESDFKLSYYSKKLSGSSINLNTFAFDLQQAIEKYEKRLMDIAVTISYIREHKGIYISVKGVIINSQEEYKFTMVKNIWN